MLNKIIRFFRRVSNVLKILAPIDTIQHDTGNLKLEVIAVNKDIFIKATRYVYAQINSTSKMVVGNSKIFPYVSIEPGADGTLYLGTATKQFNQAFLKSSIVTPYQFPATIITDFTALATQVIELPSTTPSGTADYSVYFEYLSVTSTLCKLLVSGKTSTQFEVTGYDGANALVDNSDNNENIKCFVVFNPAP